LISNYAVFLGNGDGTFRSPMFLAIPLSTCNFDQNTNCNASVGATAIGDFNGDGLPDLVLGWAQVSVASVATNLLSFMNDSPGDGFLAPGVLAPTGGVPVGINSILSAYGTNLAPATASATGPPYPTALGGIQLSVGGTFAPLVYVSPTQINYLLPQIQNPSQPINPASLAIAVQPLGQPLVQKGLAVPQWLTRPPYSPLIHLESLRQRP